MSIPMMNSGAAIALNILTKVNITNSNSILLLHYPNINLNVPIIIANTNIAVINILLLRVIIIDYLRYNSINTISLLQQPIVHLSCLFSIESLYIMSHSFEG